MTKFFVGDENFSDETIVREFSPTKNYVQNKNLNKQQIPNSG